MRVTRLRASPRHGLSETQGKEIAENLLPIRRGGVPSGAAALILM